MGKLTEQNTFICEIIPRSLLRVVVVDVFWCIFSITTESASLLTCQIDYMFVDTVFAINHTVYLYI